MMPRLKGNKGLSHTFELLQPVIVPWIAFLMVDNCHQQEPLFFQHLPLLFLFFY